MNHMERQHPDCGCTPDSMKQETVQPPAAEDNKYDIKEADQQPGNVSGTAHSV